MTDKNKYINNFSFKQLNVLKYVLKHAENFAEEVKSSNDPQADKRAAFVAGFYLGYDLNGGELPPEPLD